MKRRTFLIGAFAGTAALALGVNHYHPELTPTFSKSNSEHALLFGVLLPVFLDGALPDVPTHRDAALNRTVEAINHAISVLPIDKQAELEQLLGLLESRLGVLLLTGSMTPLMLRTPTELVAMLERWRNNYLDLLVTAYQGLRELVMASYYGCPEHWSRLNYVKPDLFGANS